MYKSEWNIMEKLPRMLTGEELRQRLAVYPDYDESIRNESQAVRLMELSNLNSFYYPADMSVEIYTELYLALMKSMKKKENKLAVLQRNINGKNLRNFVTGSEVHFDGIMGGNDSFSILGCSGIGKTTALIKTIRLLEGEQVIEMEKPYCKIIPIINVQCPFDCSARSMLLAILQKIDFAIGTDYYNKTIKSKANTNMMLVSVSQILLNHVAVLCIDEIQNLIKHKAGMQLVSMLTELLNESGVNIVFIGTPEIESFFSEVDYLARRTLGLHYDKCEYNQHFREFCMALWKFQYVSNESELTDAIINWLYQHSSGVWAHVVFLFYTAQELSILDGREIVDIQSLEASYGRMRMLHTHIQPEVSLKKKASKKKNKNISSKVMENQIERKILDETVADESLTDNVTEIPVNKGTDAQWTFTDIAKEAKQRQLDMAELLIGKVSVMKLAV